MLWRAWLACFRVFLTVVGLVVVCASCSADSAAEPEPDMTVPGTFVAVEDTPGQFLVLQTILALRLSSGETLFLVSILEGSASSFDESRSIAQEQPARYRTLRTSLISGYFAARAWRVVWFRTLEEERRNPF